MWQNRICRISAGCIHGSPVAKEMIISKENARLESASNVTAGHLFCLPTNLIMSEFMFCHDLWSLPARLH